MNLFELRQAIEQAIPVKYYFGAIFVIIVFIYLFLYGERK